jgi:heat shock protein HtpX
MTTRKGLNTPLKKLADANRRIPMNIPPAQSHMFIVMPLTVDKSMFTDLFRTHPNTEDRIAKLVRMMAQAA